MDELAEARRKLAAIEKIVEDHINLRGMDNMWPEGWAEEIEAVLADTACRECGDYPRRVPRPRPMHYTHCSQYRRQT